MEEIKQLQPFVGIWHTEGKILSNSGAPAIEIEGTDAYEWLPGEYVLLHKVDVLMGTTRKKSIEVIAFDALSKSYIMHHFDPFGSTGTMHASYQDGFWKFLGESIRFSGSFNESEDIFSGVWEQLNDSYNWHHWMDIKLSRVR